MNDVQMISVRVDTEEQQYPCLAISEIGNPKPDDGFGIPVELWQNLRAAYDALDAAETAVMVWIADHYPRAVAVHEWLGRETVAPDEHGDSA